MDAVSAAGSILSILDVLTRSILTLYDIQRKLQECNITLAALIGELTATKAALWQLQETVTEHAGREQHEDLVSVRSWRSREYHPDTPLEIQELLRNTRSRQSTTV